ncbi:MAG: TolC family protein, partial [Caldimonas sp.]
MDAPRPRCTPSGRTASGQRATAWRKPAIGRLVQTALGLLLVVGATAPAGAQSLLELYDAAHTYDAAYLSARALAESVPYRIEQSEALLRPSASLGSSASRVETNPPIFPSYGSNNLSLSVTGRQPLFNRANEATVRQAEKGLDLSRADLDAAEQDLILRLSQAYFDVLGAQDTLATTRTAKAAISEQLASAKRNFEVGTATITDTREAQARFDLATAQEIAADNDLVTKRIALDQLVGRPNVVPKQLSVPVALPAVAP